MYAFRLLCLALALLLICLPSCAWEGDRPAKTQQTEAETTCIEVSDIPTKGEESMTNRKLTVSVGTRNFSAVLYLSAAAEAFAEMLPMTVEMQAMAHEKYCDLPHTLPTATEHIGAIEAGDLMLWGDDCLVLFYESFTTSYSYTRLGVVENPAGLAEALGSGTVTVSFAVSDG